MQLSALAAAVRVQPDAYLQRHTAYADSLDAYWRDFQNVRDYDVLPLPKPPDRYYDDNAWIVLALVETFEDSGQAKYLARAEEIMRFVMSGEDNRLGGGIFWHEGQLETKNT